MTAPSYITGSKGGGGKGGGGGTARAPVEAPDSLRSRAYGRVLDLICEGEIEGPANGWDDPMLSTYLNETVIRNLDGTFNFTGVTMQMRPGTQSQSYINGFPGVEREEPVGVEVTQATPIVQTITNVNANAVRVTLGFPQVSVQNPTSGDVDGTTIDIAIDVQTDGGGYVERFTKTISGKAMSRYQESYVIPLGGPGPWDVRVRRITPDNGSAVLVNESWWDSFTEIIDVKLRYPNSALAGLIIDSKQFNAIPNRAYDLYLQRIHVPSNYDPSTRSYSGSWDGTFKVAWSDNPAWCFYDLVTTARYGLGNYIAADQVDKWALYAIARYCDELVADGFGGFEPRFTCNLYLQTREEAYNVLRDLASCFRGMVYWANGAVTVVQDAPQDAAYLYTKSNIVGKFSYAGSSQKQRHTVAMVRWNDPADFYRQKIEYVEDKAGIERYGIIEAEIVSVGCTSRGQAHRAGRWLLYSELSETETETHRTGIEGAIGRPGQIIKVQDADRAAARRSGRVSSATINTVTVDQTITLDPGINTLHVMMPDGTVATAEVTDADGAVLTLNTSLLSVPSINAIWMLASDILAPQTFRVMAAIESSEGVYEISALKHNPNKYAQIEDGLVLEMPQISLLNRVPDAPASVTINERLYAASMDFKTLIEVSWPTVAGAIEYEVSYSRNNGNFTALPISLVNTVEVRDAQSGLYQFEVVAVSATGRRSSVTSKEQQIYGKTAPPADVINFYINGTQLTWSPVADIDVAGYRIKFQPGTSRSWKDAIEVHQGLITDSPYNMSIVPSGQNTLMIKAIDTSGNESANPAFIVVNLGDPDIANVVETFDRKAAAWPGALVGGSIDGSDHLVADSEVLMWNVDPAAAMWAVDSQILMWALDLYKQMTYEDQILVSAALAGSRMTIARTISGNPWSIQYRENGPELMWSIDDSVLMYGDEDDEVWRLPPYLAWPGEIIARNTLYDFLITTGQGAIAGEVDDFSIIIDAPDIEETLDDVVIGSGGTRLAITKNYQVIKNIQLTLQSDGGGAITARYEDKDTAAGPLIKCFNLAGAAVAGVLDARVKGY